MRGTERGIIVDDKRMICHGFKAEEPGVVKQTHIHATAVGRVMVHHLVNRWNNWILILAETGKVAKFADKLYLKFIV